LGRVFKPKKGPVVGPGFRRMKGGGVICKTGHRWKFVETPAQGGGGEGADFQNQKEKEEKPRLREKRSRNKKLSGRKKEGGKHSCVGWRDTEARKAGESRPRRKNEHSEQGFNLAKGAFAQGGRCPSRELNRSQKKKNLNTGGRGRSSPYFTKAWVLKT